MFGGSESGLDALLHRSRPSWLQLFAQTPFKTMARTLYALRTLRSITPLQPPIQVVCVSDTHNSQPTIPEGDLFIHAGDLTQSGTYEEIQSSLDWISSLSHRYKIVIAGNHDLFLDPQNEVGGSIHKTLNWGSIIYLQDSSVTLSFDNGRKLKLYGSPWSRKHGNWAFQHEKGADIYAMTFPEDTDVLISHGPPRFHLDLDGLGDEYLLREVKRVKPRLHVFGHVHEGFGTEIVAYDDFEDAYESIYRGESGLGALALMIMLLCKHLVLGRSPLSRTTLVNASAVGGLKDEVKRTPVTVRL